ncbi:hypothetical protein D9619_002987 [Psilocybe cf. subviscida]|uniref:Pentacotripeptide-repeat region of PRORP domain-containing protein n=1 Tax=Psilocybe cf. subviscida TaxID=2480587 RepID=A0A8H5AXK6_9AGAR|nr:hypothetical protein D9619_002987 [Psilocybe cf. subviscida]
MLRTTSSVNLFDFLIPSLSSRTRAFSLSTAVKAKISSGTPRHRDAALLHSTLRDLITGQGHRKAVPESSKKRHNDLLSGIKTCLEKQDVEGVLAFWNQFQQERATHLTSNLYVLPEKAERQMGSLLQSNMKPLLRGKTRDDVRQFALQAATRDLTETLGAIMQYHLDRKEPQTVIGLYHTYLQMQEKEKATSGTGDESLLLEDDEESRRHPGRATLLLLAVVAHAMQDTFIDAVCMYEMANTTPLLYRRQKLLKSLQDDPKLQKKVQDYLHRLGIAHIVSQPIALTKHITNLSHPKSSRILEQLYNDVLDGISGADPYLAVSSTVASPSQVPMSEAGWTAFQTGFIRCERPDLAEKMWKDLDGCGFTPGTTMWTALLDTFVDLRDSAQAMRTWNNMLENGVKPDNLSYRAIISALFDDNKPSEALQRFREYHQILKGQGDLAMPVYNTVLRGLLRVNRISDANALLAVMSSNGPKPDIVTFNTFLGYYSRQKDFKAISDVVGQMTAANIPGDVVTFSTILTALLSVGRKDATTTILNIMRKQGIQPNVATYSAIIDHQMREDTPDNVAAALSILDKMEQNESTKPNEVTYTSILSGLYRNQSISRQQVEGIKRDLLNRMKRSKIVLRIPTYHILIRAAMNSSDPEGYVDALAFMEEMDNQGLPVTTTAWYMVLAGLMHRQLWDVAKEMADKLLTSRHNTTPRLERLIDEIRSH